MDDLDKDYIAPADALKKLRAARSIRQTVYIYGATGYGKTELVRQYLANRRYRYISCEENIADGIGRAGPGRDAVVVVDDLHLLKNIQQRREILEMTGQEEIWLILIGRSPLPSWLMPSYVREGFLVITEGDLSLKQAEIAAYLKAQQVSFTEEDLAFLSEKSCGNAYIVRHAALKMQEGKQMGRELQIEIRNAFADYLEHYVMVQWDSDLMEFLMQVSVTEEFTLPLAEMITGNRRAKELLKRASETGNFIFCDHGVYRLRPVLVKALRKRAEKVYGPEKMMDFVYNAGLYYEMHDQIVPALTMFELCGRRERVKELLIRNARLNPGSGHYFELRQYYLQLEEEEIAESAVLMAGMSMLYSLLMQEEESEYWYGKLKRYAEMAKGGQKREALRWLVYLDIALPHRGSADMIDIMKRVPSLLFDKGISLPEFSVTSNCPSTMNGGKDFCHWSKNDRKLAVSIGKLVERVLGNYGRGFVKAALAESLYEKGENNYEVLALLARAQMEMESVGMMELQFAAAGIQVRLDMLQGELRTARAVLDSFEEKVIEQGVNKLLPNISALRCRLALRDGDRDMVKAWMDTAPDEGKEFYILERYRYLTKVRCYLFEGEYLQALTLLEKLRYYAEKCRRTYISIEVSLLSAVTKQRMGGEWKEDFLTALKEACEYHFLRLISEEGAAVQELFTAAGKNWLEKEIADKKWFASLLEETEKMAVRYPVYLKSHLAKAPHFCDTALAVLRLQAEGMSVNRIAQELSMKASTVKYHTQENYRKLGVSGKADAVLAARNLGIL